jgi:hypothetical protein
MYHGVAVGPPGPAFLEIELMCTAIGGAADACVKFARCERELRRIEEGERVEQRSGKEKRSWDN